MIRPKGPLNVPLEPINFRSSLSNPLLANDPPFVWFNGILETPVDVCALYVSLYPYGPLAHTSLDHGCPAFPSKCQPIYYRDKHSLTHRLHYRHSIVSMTSVPAVIKHSELFDLLNGESWRPYRQLVRRVRANE